MPPHHLDRPLAIAVLASEVRRTTLDGVPVWNGHYRIIFEVNLGHDLVCMHFDVVRPLRRLVVLVTYVPPDLHDVSPEDLVANLLDAFGRHMHVDLVYRRLTARRYRRIRRWTSRRCRRRRCILAYLHVVIQRDLGIAALILVLDDIELDEIARHQYLKGIDPVHKRGRLTVASLSRLRIARRVFCKEVRLVGVLAYRDRCRRAKAHRGHSDFRPALISDFLQTLSSSSAEVPCERAWCKCTKRRSSDGERQKHSQFPISQCTWFPFRLRDPL